jgi:flagellar biosynthesis GTPase FlhF
MQIDKFQAQTLQEAVEIVRQRWGPEAVILHIEKRTTPGGLFHRAKETIEVIARAPQSNSAPVDHKPPVFPAQAPNSELDVLREELNVFRNTIRQIGNVQSARNQVESAPLKHPMLNFMVKRGMGSHYALELLADWAVSNPALDISQCIADMDRRLRRMEWNLLFPADEGRCTLLVGLPGCGKTLLLLKIAARLRLGNQHHVVLVSADMSRPGPSEELSLYSETLQIPITHIFNLEELTAIAKNHPPRTHLLVDWPGISPYSPESWKPLVGLASYHPHPQLLLTASLASDLRTWELVRESLAPLHLPGLALTQADLEHRLGKIWEAARGTNLPIALISAGKNVPGDLYEGGSFPFAKHFFCGYNNFEPGVPSQTNP